MARKITNSEFIQICKSYHDVYRLKYDLPPYDYSKTEFKSMKNNPIIITCPIHGDFEIKSACNHSNGNHSGCPECGKLIARKKRILDSDTFFNKCREVHGNLYDYSESVYNGYSEPITYWCPNCKQHVTQIAGNHVSGEGCIGCYRKNNIPENKFTTETFIQRVKETHPNKEYDFSRTEYVNRETNVIIGCKKHGWFETNPGNFINTSRNSDCPMCSAERLKENTTSIYEKQLGEFIESLLGPGKIQYNNREVLGNGQELDIYIPAHNVAIEINGLYWHSSKFKPKNYHVSKSNQAEKNGIHLIQIFENEWLLARNIIESRLKQVLNIQEYTIPARKCIIKPVPTDIERQFLNANHLQGYIGSRLCYGLYYKNESNNKEYLVALMSFGKTRKNLGSNGSGWELYRYCSLCNFSIQGGASKLFKHFVKQNNPESIISYANRCWSIDNESNLYNKLGFEYKGVTEPNYFYINGIELINRFSLRKDILISKYGCKTEMTEKEFVENILGYQRIYDCGNLKYIYIWTKKSPSN